MQQVRSVVCDAASIASSNPKAALTLLFFVLFVASQGAVAAESAGDLLVGASDASHGSSDGP